MKDREDLELEDKKEGEELQKLGVQYHVEKERLENIRKEEKGQLMKDNMRQIMEKATIKKVLDQQEEVGISVDCVVCEGGLREKGVN